MTDFRISIDSPDGYLERELDWERNEHKWSLSAKAGQRWDQGLLPNSSQINYLFNFFRVDPNQLRTDSAISLSPGELALIHKNSSETQTIFATLCEKCHQHWYVFRWENGKKRWCLYGRNCDFTWEKGSELSSDKIVLLQRARGLKDNPLSPPQ